jgi:hypothetical protein
MGSVQVAPHEARPGRRAVVAVDLADLQGPARGPVELPLHLHWSGADDDRTFDLGDPGVLLWVYETVLGHASRPGDLPLLNAVVLIAAWPYLFLPAGVRAAWEEAHPVLAAAGHD